MRIRIVIAALLLAGMAAAIHYQSPWYWALFIIAAIFVLETCLEGAVRLILWMAGPPSVWRRNEDAPVD